MKSKFLLILFLLVAFNSFSYTNDEIADAIFKAEGGINAKKPYGILSVKCEGEKECRVICLNTIRNQKLRHKNHVCKLTFLECLANRYCPIGATNDPLNLNVNWLRLLKYFLNK